MKKIIRYVLVTILLIESMPNNAFWFTQASHSKPSTGTLTWQQAKNYVEQIIASFDHALRPHIKDRTLKKLKKSILDALGAHTDLYHYWGTTYYKKDLLDQYINSAILTYIEQTSYKYALKKVKQKSIAKKIADSMRNNAMARLMKYGAVDPEDLIPFIGSALKKAVREAINRFDMPYIQEPKQLYPSQDCCVCTESFEDVERIFLYPCGHDICKECAYQLFFNPQSNHTKCPLCRTTVDKHQLKNELR